MLIIRKLLIFSIVYVGFELLDIMERLANHYVATECPVCRPLDDRIWNACKTWESARSDAFLMSREEMLLIHTTKYSVINVSGWYRSSLPWHNFRLLINESMYLSLWPLTLCLCQWGGIPWCFPLCHCGLRGGHEGQAGAWHWGFHGDICAFFLPLIEYFAICASKTLQ